MGQVLKSLSVIQITYNMKLGPKYVSSFKKRFVIVIQSSTNGR